MTTRRGRGSRSLRSLAAASTALVLSSCFGAADAPEQAAPSRSVRAEATPSQATPADPSPTPDPPPEVGECRRVSIEDLRTIVNDDRVVACKRSHTTVTFHVGRIPRAAARDALSSADEHVERAANRICRSRFREHVGGRLVDRRLSMLTPTYFLPSAEQFGRGARWVRCDVYAYATPTRLADLPRSLANALERDRVSDRFTRCSPVSPSARRFRHVACSQRHAWRAVAVRTVGGRSERYPGRPTVENRARDKCEAPVRRYLDTDEAFSYGFEVPRRAAWSEGDRLALCWARTG